jgi:DNA-binding NarL/FixJ family response regulator
MRVLLIDDHAPLRSALRLMLEEEGDIDVVGEAANIRPLALFIKDLIKDLDPDLLFLDWQMPGLESNRARQQLINSVRAVDPDLYIVALTNDEYARSALSFGADAYVNKAESPEKIMSVVHGAAKKRQQRNATRGGSYDL